MIEVVGENCIEEESLDRAGRYTVTTARPTPTVSSSSTADRPRSNTRAARRHLGGRARVEPRGEETPSPGERARRVDDGEALESLRVVPLVERRARLHERHRREVARATHKRREERERERGREREREREIGGRASASSSRGDIAAGRARGLLLVGLLVSAGTCSSVAPVHRVITGTWSATKEPNERTNERLSDGT